VCSSDLDRSLDCIHAIHFYLQNVETWTYPLLQQFQDTSFVLPPSATFGYIWLLRQALRRGSPFAVDINWIAFETSFSALLF
jgi:hypothetical protein